MQTDRKLEKAHLTQIHWDEQGVAAEIDATQRLKVQFNPATLKVSYANQVQTNDQSTSSATQYVGRGSSKMSLELIFDVSMPLETGDAPADVRVITEKVFNFMKPLEEPGEGDTTRYVAPGVRFQWGTFFFDGIAESLDESLELWSEDGRPLRATVTMNLSQQGIVFLRQDPSGTGGAPAGAATVGVTPMQPAQASDSVQSMAARAGRSGDWKQIAQANGIDNPRSLAPGQLVNIQISVRRSP